MLDVSKLFSSEGSCAQETVGVLGKELKLRLNKKNMENKRAVIGIIILVILGILVVAGTSTAVYFYNFHVFKEFKLCISDKKIQDTKLPCSTNEFCINSLKSNITELEQLKNLPDFLKEKSDELFEKAIFCEQTCKFRQIKGEPFTEKIENCNANEQEISVQIKGKEGLEILRFMKENQDRI
ncbi:MAG: hypothetical protein AABW67_06525 [Nanoarchaeota archaeon]